jgi:hypothetical protein
VQAQGRVIDVVSSSPAGVPLISRKGDGVGLDELPQKIDCLGVLSILVMVQPDEKDGSP